MVRVVAALAAEAIQKQLPELGKYVRFYDYVVAKDGSGDFFSVQEAINAVPDFRKTSVQRFWFVKENIKNE